MINKKHAKDRNLNASSLFVCEYRMFPLLLPLTWDDYLNPQLL